MGLRALGIIDGEGEDDVNYTRSAGRRGILLKLPMTIMLEILDVL